MTVPAIYCNECGASNALQATHCFACNHALHSPTPPSPISVQATFPNAAVPPDKLKAIGGPLVPSTLLHSRYIIVNQISTGGFGAVYQAKDTLFSNSLVAIKDARIASGGVDATVQVWSIGKASITPQGQIMALRGNILMYRGHTGQVTSLTWSPYGQLIASGSEDGTVQIWQAM